MVALLGLVGNFWQLLLVRVGIAVGEAGCIPPAQSLISDYFDRKERPQAQGVYSMSGPLAILIGFLAGGWLLEEYGWRSTFIIIGIPGLFLAVLVKFTLREPRLGGISGANNVTNNEMPDIKQMPLRQVLTTLWQGRAFRHLVVANCIFVFFNQGLGAWTAAFFMRSHGMEAGVLGVWLGLSVGLGGLLFAFFGGMLATRYAPGRERLQMKSVAIINVLCSLFYVLCYWSDNKYLALIFLVIDVGVLKPLTFAPVFSVIQSLVVKRMRAVAFAFIVLLANLVGLGLGPVVVGMLSDFLAVGLGAQSLRYALLLLSPGYLWCAYHYWKVSETVEDDIRLTEEKADSMEKGGAVAKRGESYRAVASQ